MTSGPPNSSHVLRIVGMAAIAACAACCSTSNARRSILPIDARFEAEVSIDGSAARFVLDTGSQATMIMDASAERLALEPAKGAPTWKITDSTGTVRDAAHSVVFEDLCIGDWSFTDFPVPVLPSHQWFRADGIIGSNVLRCGVWIFDVPARRAAFLDRAQLEQTLAELGLLIESRLALTVRDLKAFVEVELEGARRVTLLLDTGSNRTMLLAEDIDALELPSGEALAARQQQDRDEEIRKVFEAAGISDVTITHSDGPSSAGVHGVQRDTSRRHLSRLQLGNRVFEDLVVSARPEAASHGVLGTEVLGELPWALDLDAGELLILARR